MFTGLTKQEQKVLMLLVALMTVFIGFQTFQASHQTSRIQVVALDQFETANPAGAVSVADSSGVDAVRRELQSGSKPLLLAQAEKEKININTASATELEKLYRVGPKTAEKIIAYREQNGPFQKIEDIQKVAGIGPKTFEKMQDMITVGGPESAPAAKPEPAAAQPAAEAAAPAASAEKSVEPASSAAAAAPAAAQPESKPAAKPASSAGKININTATEADLVKLKGVGPATATRIIEERQAHGPFKKPEDLKRVKGIGDKTLEKFVNDITFGE